MAHNISRRVDAGALLRAPFAAMQWRLLLLWVVLLLIPTAVVSLPLWRALGGLLDHSVHAPEWARSFHAMMFGDVVMALGREAAPLAGAALAGLLVAALLLPLLNGMVVASGRAGRALGFGHLLQSGVIEYGRMFRLMLWSLLPYGVAIALAALVVHAADARAAKVVLQSRADSLAYAANGLGLVAFVLAQAVMESARAAFVADVSLRSATRALGRGLVQLVRRPLFTLLSYLLISAVGFVLVLLLGVARIHTPALGHEGVLLALLLSQLVAAVLGWMHAARVFALAQIAGSLRPARRAGGLPTAL